MAIGLLGSGSSSNTVPTTVYTVPGGISHAVVHITLTVPGGALAGSGDVQVAGSSLLYITTAANASAPIQSVSVMLSSGNVVTVTGANGQPAYCTVSGYTVA
jgi:hypothetical protein